MQDQSCVIALQFSIQSLLLIAKGVECTSTFPSIAALNVHSVSLAGFACYVLDPVLPAAALVSGLTSSQLPRVELQDGSHTFGFQCKHAL